MPKLTRRLLRVAGLSGLAACGLLTAACAAGPAAARPAAKAAGQRATASPEAVPAAVALKAPAHAAASPPAGFWSGSDSNYIPIPGGHPYREPVLGGPYGGYIGMTGNWADWQHCGGQVVWSRPDASAARTNLIAYHRGIGTGAYWFMAGPGVDPHYNGSYREAFAWGQAQAAAALRDIRSQTPRINYQVVFLDVELPGNAPTYTPASDNGWTSVYTAPCSGRVRIHSISAHVNRGDFNGFAAYLTAHSRYKAGVYSSPGVWQAIFGAGADARITSTFEWTYTGDTSSLSHPPRGWCLARTRVCAQFFGGMTSRSRYALMWQWSGGGGTNNGYGDFDQIDGNRSP